MLVLYWQTDFQSQKAMANETAVAEPRGVLDQSAIIGCETAH